MHEQDFAIPSLRKETMLYPDYIKFSQTCYARRYMERSKIEKKI